MNADLKNNISIIDHTVLFYWVHSGKIIGDSELREISDYEIIFVYDSDKGLVWLSFMAYQPL